MRYSNTLKSIAERALDGEYLSLITKYRMLMDLKEYFGVDLVGKVDLTKESVREIYLVYAKDIMGR